MRELHTREPVGRSRMTAFKEGPGQSWERLQNGDYVLKTQAEPGVEYVLPMTSIKYERRAAPAKTEAKK